MSPTTPAEQARAQAEEDEETDDEADREVDPRADPYVAMYLVFDPCVMTGSLLRHSSSSTGSVQDQVSANAWRHKELFPGNPSRTFLQHKCVTTRSAKSVQSFPTCL